MSFISFYKQNPEQAALQWSAMSFQKQCSFVRDLAHVVTEQKVNQDPSALWGDQMVSATRTHLFQKYTAASDLKSKEGSRRLIKQTLEKILSVASGAKENIVEEEFSAWRGWEFEDFFPPFVVSAIQGENLQMLQSLLDRLPESSRASYFRLEQSLFHSWPSAQLLLSHPRFVTQDTLHLRTKLLLCSLDPHAVEVVLTHHRSALQDLLMQHLKVEDVLKHHSYQEVLFGGPASLSSTQSLGHDPSLDRYRSFLLQHLSTPRSLKHQCLEAVLSQNEEDFRRSCEQLVLAQDDHVPDLNEVFSWMFALPCSEQMWLDVLDYLPYITTESQVIKGLAEMPLPAFEKMMKLLHPTLDLSEMMYNFIRSHKEDADDGYLVAMAHTIDRDRFVEKMNAPSLGPSLFAAQLLNSFISSCTPAEILNKFDRLQEKALNRDLKTNLLPESFVPSPSRKI